jgi:hypothetical protein
MATVFTDGQSQRFGAQTNKKCDLELDGRGSRIGILADLELSDPNAGLQPVLFFFRKTVGSSFWKGYPAPRLGPSRDST